MLNQNELDKVVYYRTKLESDYYNSSNIIIKYYPVFYRDILRAEYKKHLGSNIDLSL